MRLLLDNRKILFTTCRNVSASFENIQEKMKILILNVLL